MKYPVQKIQRVMEDIGSSVLAMRRENRLAVRTKKDAFDLQTTADRFSEKKIGEFLQSLDPAIRIRGEEGLTAYGTSPYEAIIDPIDGTIPFVAGQDNFSISLGFLHRGVPDAGFIYFPAQRKFVHALRGHGVRINGSPVRLPRRAAKLNTVLVGFDFSAGADRRREIKKFAAPIAHRALGIRIEGSFTGAVLRMLEGTLGAYMHPAAPPFDLAAPLVVAKEAGFAVSKTWDLDKEHSPIVLARTVGLLNAIEKEIFSHGKLRT